MNKLLSAPFTLSMDIFRRSLVVRYIFSGGVSAGIDVGIFFILSTYTLLHYIYASGIAMTSSFIVRFLLQKYVTFQDRNEEGVSRQFFYYTILYFASLFATVGFMYVFVDIFGLWKMLAQVCTIVLIAIACFFIYRIIIFKKQ